MPNPLIRQKAPPIPHEGRDGVPWSDYVRVIEFVDKTPPDSEDAPVHVMGRVLLDGVATLASVARDSVTVDLGGGGTIVTLHVWHEDVQIGTPADEDPYRPHLIGGRHVLTPVGDGWDWVPEDPADPEGFIVCSLYVAQVRVY